MAFAPVNYSRKTYAKDLPPAYDDISDLNDREAALEQLSEDHDAETDAGRAMTQAADAAAQRTLLNVEDGADVTDEANVTAIAVATDEVTAAPAHWWVLVAGALKRMTHAGWTALVLAATGKTNAATGFTIAGGTTSRTLTVSADADTKDIPTATGKTNADGATATQTAGKVPLYNAAKGINADGISFPATQVPSADANTLDDYEEGTWTPKFSGGTVAGVQTYTVQDGSYVKVGSKVTLSFNLTISAKDAAIAGTAIIVGLPFSSISGGNYRSSAAIGRYSGVTLDSGFTQLMLTLWGGASSIYFYQSGSTKTTGTMQVTSFGNNLSLSGTITYRSV